eukprot:scaffold55519_cov36-Tisochrysis_lutea.AAC.2
MCIWPPAQLTVRASELGRRRRVLLIANVPRCSGLRRTHRLAHAPTPDDAKVISQGRVLRAGLVAGIWRTLSRKATAAGTCLCKL